jgi:hypothetical protein
MAYGHFLQLPSSSVKRRQITRPQLQMIDHGRVQQLSAAAIFIPPSVCMIRRQRPGKTTSAFSLSHLASILAIAPGSNLL